MNARLIARNSNLNSSGQTIIQIRYTHKSKNFHISTGLTIKPQHWDYSKECIKKSKRGYIKLNAILMDKKQKVFDIVHSFLLQDIDPTVELVKDTVLGKNIKKEIPKLIDFVVQFIEDSKSVRSKATIRAYQVSLKFLLDYQTYKNIKLSYEDINLEFYYDYIRYMHSVKGNSVNGLSNKIKHLKVWMERAFDLGYHTNISYKNKKFCTPKAKAHHIYLTELEITSLLKLDLSKSTRLERVRDLFGIACLTGLRYSDIDNLKPQHFKSGFIQLNTKKGNKEVVIPIHPALKIILNRYKTDDGKYLLPKISNAKLNAYVKELGKLGKINEEIIINVDIAGVVVEQIKKKYTMISSHTGRRSFISNLLLRGVDSQIIKKLTGHSSESFVSYVKFSNHEAAAAIAKLWVDTSAMRVVA